MDVSLALSTPCMAPYCSLSPSLSKLVRTCACIAIVAQGPVHEGWQGRAHAIAALNPSMALVRYGAHNIARDAVVVAYTRCL